MRSKVFRFFLLLVLTFEFQISFVYALENTPRPQKTKKNPLNQSTRPNLIPCMQDDGCSWSEGVGAFGYTDFNCVATYITYNEKPAILTAGHCLKDENVGDEIDGFFLLPAIVKNNRTYNTEEVDLLRVERRFNERENGLDIAIVSLKEAPLFHKPRSISQNEFVYGENYSFIGKNFDPKIKNNYWSLQENCILNKNNLFALKSIRPMMSFLGNCSVGKGNSGAPVFDENGDLIAVMKSFVKIEDLLIFYSFFIKKNFITKTLRPLLKISYANVSWLDCLQNNFSTVDPKCTPIEKFNSLKKEELPEEDGSLFTFVSDIPLYNKLDVFIPNCIKNSDIGIYKTDETYQKYTLLKIYHPELDGNLDLSATGKIIESYSFALLDEVKDQDAFLLTFRATHDSKRAQFLFDTKVPICK